MKISFYDPDEEPTSSSAENFTLNWPAQLGWKSNPFELEGRIAGMEQEKQEINLFFIKKRNFGSLTGDTGSGKTTLLRWLSKALANDFRVVLVQENTHASPAALRSEIADVFRGMFSRGKDISDAELVDLLKKKSRKKPIAILIDEIDDHENGHATCVEQICALPSVHVLVSGTKIPSGYKSKDQLELSLKKRDEEQLAAILRDRIEAVGGQDIIPFTEDIISDLAEKSSSTGEFLQLAHEAAIHLALNDGVIGSTKKKSKKKKDSVKSKDRTKYDDLIESLGEELTR